MKKPGKVIGIRLSTELLSKLIKEAQLNQRSVSAQIRYIISLHFIKQTR